MKVGHVPLLAYARPGDLAVADRVAAAIEHAERIGVPIRALSCWRGSARTSGPARPPRRWRASRLEETARLARGADPKPAPLAPEAIDELRRSFGARW